MSDDLKILASSWEDPPEVTYRKRRNNLLTVWTVRRTSLPLKADTEKKGVTWLFASRTISIPKAWADRLVALGEAVLDAEGVLHFLPWTAKPIPEPGPWQVFQ